MVDLVPRRVDAHGRVAALERAKRRAELRDARQPLRMHARVAERDERLGAGAARLLEPVVDDLALEAHARRVVGRDEARLVDAEVLEALVDEHRGLLLADPDRDARPRAGRRRRRLRGGRRRHRCGGDRRVGRVRATTGGEQRTSRRRGSAARRGGGCRRVMANTCPDSLGCMSTYELVADLPLTIEGYDLEGLAQYVSSDFERKSTIIHLRGDGEEGVGEDVVYDAVDHEIAWKAGPVAAPRRRLDAALVLPSTSHDRPLPRGAAARRLAAVPRVGVRVGGARPRAAPGRPAAARRAAPRAPAADVRRLAAPRRAALAGAGLEPPGPLPDAALQARPDGVMGRRPRRAARRDGRGRLRGLQGPLRGDDRRSARPTRRSTRGSSTRSPTRGSRTPSSRRRSTRCSSHTATGSRGTRTSTRSPTSRGCRSRRGW